MGGNKTVIGCHGDISDLNSPGLCVLLFMYDKLCFLSLALREAMRRQSETHAVF